MYAPTDNYKIVNNPAEFVWIGDGVEDVSKPMNAIFDISATVVRAWVTQTHLYRHKSQRTRRGLRTWIATSPEKVSVVRVLMLTVDGWLAYGQIEVPSGKEIDLPKIKKGDALRLENFEARFAYRNSAGEPVFQNCMMGGLVKGKKTNALTATVRRAVRNPCGGFMPGRILGTRN
jgi:hypothetical protein